MKHQNSAKYNSNFFDTSQKPEPEPQYYHFGYQVNTKDDAEEKLYHGHTQQADSHSTKGKANFLICLVKFKL